MLTPIDKYLNLSIINFAVERAELVGPFTKVTRLHSF
jgi:hypothetical protein